jgi:putative transposase
MMPYKQIVLDNLKWLSEKQLVHIYGYVIMPNHIHLLWEQLKMNGKEFPKIVLKNLQHMHFEKNCLQTIPGSWKIFV